ncbi:MAG TPA: SpoIIE family protein phosphatase [Bacteroidales bacterium]|nr:SpoIIE family protein phosphatase [Bacteroidales bacterium]
MRVDDHGIITGANDAAEKMFSKESLNGDNIRLLFKELSDLNVPGIIRKSEKINITVRVNGRILDLTLKGINSIITMNVYANEITQIVMAENKIKEQANNINDSIVYASRIQLAILPEERILKQIFPECFVFYRPKNVVSGDFYWVNQVGDMKIVAVADCTGHGVPGAFMSMLGISLLNELILREQITDSDEILNILRERLILSLSSGSNKADVKDGMDISLAVIDTKTQTISFSGAYNPMFICRDDKLLILEADRMPVGKHFAEYSPFTAKKEQVLPGDRVFMFSDGFKDQFGGINNRKYSSRSFKELILKTNDLPFDSVYSIMEEAFDSWKQDAEQVDDVLVMGFKILKDN